MKKYAKSKSRMCVSHLFKIILLCFIYMHLFLNRLFKGVNSPIEFTNQSLEHIQKSSFRFVDTHMRDLDFAYFFIKLIR
jgi:hypothetical protein